MKTMVGTGEGPEKYNGYKPADKNPYKASREEELRPKPRPGKGNIGPQGYAESPKDPYAPKDKGYYQEQQKPKKLIPKKGGGLGMPDPNTRAARTVPEGYPGVYQGTRGMGPNNPPPAGWPTESQVAKRRIKTTLRGGMGSGRGDNPNGTQGYY